MSGAYSVHAPCMLGAWFVHVACSAKSHPLAASAALSGPAKSPTLAPSFNRRSRGTATLSQSLSPPSGPRRILIRPANDKAGFSEVIPVRYLIIPLLAALLSGCDRPGRPDGLTVVFEDIEEPAAFYREGLGRRTANTDSPGLWAVVQDLPRPETAIIRNPRTKNQITVPLFAARRSGDEADVELSVEAADALGIGEEPVAITVTAVRTEPNLIVPEDVF